MPPNTHVAFLKNHPGADKPGQDKRIASGSQAHCERILAKYEGQYEGYVRELTPEELR